MVLSNKKLKQKLRAELSSRSIAFRSGDSNFSNSTSPQAQQSVKQLLDLTIPKPRLNKRGKLRNTLSLRGFDAANANGENNDGHFLQCAPEIKEAGWKNSGSEIHCDMKKRKREKEDKEGDAGSLTDGNRENSDKRKKKKKRKNGKQREGVRGGDDGKDGNDVKREAEKPMKKEKKKKKKTMKKKAKEEQKKRSIAENPTSAGDAEESNNLNSQENGEVFNKVYVGGIPYYSTEDDIRSYFDHCGSITDVDCMKFPESGKFRGISIISFKTEEAAKRALTLNGADMGGLFLKIQPYKTTRAAKTSDFSPPIIEGYNRVYVGNLAWDITEDDLRKLLSNCSISSVRFGKDKETGEFKGYAHVDFSDSSSVTQALKLDQKMVRGRPVRIRTAVPKKGTESADSVSTLTVAKTSSVGVSSGKLKRRTCYDCGERGHISSACPGKQPTPTMGQIST
ncbi:hypothetical protein Nepgr_013388 [Nepenthes gracilis]|uniref:Protein gar2 n=1 Tax=Nepenthes gracilis TaxID=150966 RepID=A0AAD3XNL8_NEPGR|nr:hypothetical protein Nepgr_013388 [Nepenthes gracilis]